ncbi:uncharacterized protein LOC111699750 [Eurytemora carolleeae]|uniref:uncharacterized protein LOC111699750 n=1 Tax=Eurytemora carolleeae TaxID=1294199 RepID=UPI000C77ABE1|nr:uncharacterized protein LOC111699750 [Eurytemora carolleeae]|eukprot:XP_023326252.1 uncharacterized protein LOC111699750 [Eurytemora affinis]
MLSAQVAQDEMILRYFDGNNTTVDMTDYRVDNEVILEQFCFKLVHHKSQGVIGRTHGLKALVDTEKYNNGDIHDENNLSLIVQNRLEMKDSVLFKQTASPGENTDLGLSIVKYETTEAALKLDPKIKKCLYNKDLKNLEPSLGSRINELPYSLSMCVNLLTVIDNLIKCGLNQSRWKAYGHQLHCIQSYSAEPKQLGEIELRQGQRSQCLNACNRQENLVTKSTSVYPGENFEYSEDYQLILRKIRRICSEENHPGFTVHVLNKKYPELCGVALSSEKNESEKRLELVKQYARDNIVSVNMYIENPFITSYTTDVEMSGLDIISSIGGLLGLFIGFSLVTLGEIVYYLLFLMFSRIITKN